jgi:hypothetical protein
MSFSRWTLLNPFSSFFSYVDICSLVTRRVFMAKLSHNVVCLVFFSSEIIQIQYYFSFVSFLLT